MIDENLAYRCFHTEEINEKRKKNKKFKSEWRDKKQNKIINKEFCVRIKSPTGGNSSVKDKIQGLITVDNSELDDFIIIRKDGTPTFLLSSAVDDHEMSVTDIIRGDDHMTNTFRQLQIFKFLNYFQIFRTCHLFIMKITRNYQKGTKFYQLRIINKKDFLKESLINYMLRMGWSYGNNEIISINDAIKKFTLEKISKSPAMIDERKLIYLNNYYINNSSEQFIFEVLQNLYKTDLSNINQSKDLILKLIPLYQDRSSTVLEIKEKLFKSSKKHIFFQMIKKKS